MNKKLYGYFILSFSIFIIDRITKLCALNWCGETVYVINPFLSFDLTFNRGISWGIFHSTSDNMFYIVSLMIAIFTAMFSWYAYRRYMHGYSVIGEVCVISGSLCNLIDRVLYKGVIDFILLSCGNLSWPVFNVADMAIIIGAGILIMQCE
jgi:signal peptidase II